MQGLRIEVDGKALDFEERRPLRIGRALDAEILLSGETVSRVHAELRPSDRGWILVDVGSQHGTFVSGQRVSEFRVTQPVSVYFGLRDTGAVVRIVPPSAPPPAPVTNRVGDDLGSAAPRPAPAPRSQTAENRLGEPAAAALSERAKERDGREALGPPAAFADTVAVGGPGVARSEVGEPPSGPELLARLAGASRRFPHPTPITIGRHPDSTIVLDDPVASRYHGRIDPIPGGWTYVNVSEKGTYVEGRRREQIRLTSEVRLHLGHPVAGHEIVLTPVRDAAADAARIRRRRRLRTVVAAAAVLTVVAMGIGVLLLGDRDDGQNTAQSPQPDELTSTELDRAKLATVLIVGRGQTTDGGRTQWHGSGSIISPEGMILTNAHVAEPQAPGLSDLYGPSPVENPDYLLIALIKSADDSPADPTYRARVLDSDGRLDASILQIYATDDGRPLRDELDLPTIELGDSDRLQTGDEVTILGFPSISQSTAVSVTTGVISTFVDDPGLAGDRNQIDTDARIAPGNSGGLAIDNAARIIGIPSSLFAPEGSLVPSGRIRPINSVKPMIETATKPTQ